MNVCVIILWQNFCNLNWLVCNYILALIMKPKEWYLLHSSGQILFYIWKVWQRVQIWKKWYESKVWISKEKKRCQIKIEIYLKCRACINTHKLSLKIYQLYFYFNLKSFLNYVCHMSHNQAIQNFYWSDIKSLKT